MTQFQSIIVSAKGNNVKQVITLKVTNVKNAVKIVNFVKTLILVSIVQLDISWIMIKNVKNVLLIVINA